MRIALALLAALSSTSALAWHDTYDSMSDASVRRRHLDPAPVGPDQTRLVIVDWAEPPPPPPPDEVPIRRGAPPWVKRHLERSRRWTDPFVGPELYPELSVGDSMQPAWDRDGRSMTMNNVLVLNLYLLEVRFPSSFADGQRPRAFSSFEADLRLPIPFGHAGRQRLVPIFGVVGPMEGGAVDSNSGARVLLGYGVAAGALLAQAYGGFGVEPDVFVAGGGRRSVARYGGSVGYNFGRHFEAQVEVDVRNQRGRGLDARLVPGVHIWPYRLPTVQLGIAGLLGLSRQPGSTEADLVGGIFELSYNFL